MAFLNNDALAYEGNTDLAFDTTVLRKCGKDYGEIAIDLRNMATKLDDCLTELKESGWTTPAGSAFHEMVNANWNTNIEKYASLLDTLKDILDEAADSYEDLVSSHVETTKLGSVGTIPLTNYLNN